MDNRREFSDNEKMILYNEVNGRCPICGNPLTHKKKSNIVKIFEVAHIYPANPLPSEIILLKDEIRLSNDVNDLKNVIVVCRVCHKKFDAPRTIDEYRSWFRLKTKLIQDAEIKNTCSLFNVESEIKVILQQLNNANIEEDLVKLQPCFAGEAIVLA